MLVLVGGRHPISSALSDWYYHHRSRCASVHHSGSVWPSLRRTLQMQQETHHWLPQSMGLPSWPVPDPRFWEHHQSVPHWAPLPGEIHMFLLTLSSQYKNSTFLLGSACSYMQSQLFVGHFDLADLACCYLHIEDNGLWGRKQSTFSCNLFCYVYGIAHLPCSNVITVSLNDIQQIISWVNNLGYGFA